MDTVREIERAVLYEGYLLWPYRRSALKNQRRFMFGGVYPDAFARREADPSELRFECLIEGPSRAQVQIEARFLHLVRRQPARLDGAALTPVDDLTVAGERHLAWEEAIEREARLVAEDLGTLTNGSAVPVEIGAGDERTWLRDPDGAPVGAILRSWQPLDGVVEAVAIELSPGLHRLAVRFANLCAWDGCVRAQALERSFLSTHVIARCASAEFVSLTDPPPRLQSEAEACRCGGLWPVLVGEPGDRSTLLAAPIILSDYPQVAPESPGDLFDGCEIDALLVHSIRSLSDEERSEMSATDPRAREILERSLGLDSQQLARLYGALRELGPAQQ